MNGLKHIHHHHYPFLGKRSRVLGNWLDETKGKGIRSATLPDLQQTQLQLGRGNLNCCDMAPDKLCGSVFKENQYIPLYTLIPLPVYTSSEKQNKSTKR